MYWFSGSWSDISLDDVETLRWLLEGVFTISLATVGTLHWFAGGRKETALVLTGTTGTTGSVTHTATSVRISNI